MRHYLMRTGVVLVLFATSAVVGAAAGGRRQASPQVPVVSENPAVQRTIEAQLSGAAAVRLDPSARISRLDLTDRPLKEILDAIGDAGGIAVRYASGVDLSVPSSVTLSDKTVEDALRTALEGHALIFQPVGARAAFVYPDTQADREKYTATVRVFLIAKADPVVLVTQLNRALKPNADVGR